MYQFDSSSLSNSEKSTMLITNFETDEGLYKLQHEKFIPAAVLQCLHAKSVSQLTLADLKEKPSHSTLADSSSGSGAISGLRTAAAKLLSAGSWKALSFVRANGSKGIYGSSRAGSLGGSRSRKYAGVSNYNGKGTYLIFNASEAILISDLYSRDKVPIKSIFFTTGYPICHAFDSDAKDGHDLLIALNTGDVYSVSLRQQLLDVGKKLVGAQHYNKGSINNSRCKSVAWVPGGNGAFIIAHANGNLYVYDKNKDGTSDCSFPDITDGTQFSVVHAQNSRNNPVARWHICQGPINTVAFSSDGAYMATAGRDGYLRVYDYLKEQFIFGGKSYCGSLLCCAWSANGKYILTGGEDDLVQVWSVDKKKITAWGEGHKSWVSGVAFDPYCSPPNVDGSKENVTYRFGSVGQDTKLLLWDLTMDGIVMPLGRPSGGSPTISNGSQPPHWGGAVPTGTLQPSPGMCDIPELSPVVSYRVHRQPLTGLIFTKESVVTISQDGLIKIWMRPALADNQSSTSENLSSIH